MAVAMASGNAIAMGIRPTSVWHVSNKLQSRHGNSFSRIFTHFFFFSNKLQSRHGNSFSGIFTHFFFSFFQTAMQTHPLLKARVVFVKLPQRKASRCLLPILFAMFIWRYTDSSHQVHRFAREMRQVFETKLKLFLLEDMSKASDDFGKQIAVKTSSSVSVKRLKKGTNNLKEIHKEKIGCELITRKRPLTKPKEKSVPSTASIVVTVSTPQAQESRKKKNRQQIRVEFGNQSQPLLMEAALKGSNKFSIHKKDVEVLKTKSSAFTVADNSDKSSGVVCDDQVKLSPNTALRIEVMKCRFAGTMLRADEKMADDKGHDGPSEVAKKEAMIKEQREKARMGLIEMKKKAEKNGQEIYNMKELEMLCGGGDYSTKVLLGLPLKKLGLHRKPDFDFAFEEEEEEDIDFMN
ncbi:hypothetical protein TIFTF001_020923 [Ficus carica]|uniref:Uncharacterized protein n=1 Tax=Ficus carica TaxID=3494 RepID=A0AA88AS37_FICCA|nr:hypothetical protein TIFTF001_020923 [Ficus carica]